MFFLRCYWKHPEFRVGVADILPTVPGMAAWGMMTGVAMVKSGMSVFEASAMTLLVYAGSSQLAAIPLIAAAAPMSVILATGLCVNLRFVVFSAHLRPYFQHLPRGPRWLTGYLIADLNYVTFVQRFPVPGESAAQRQAQQAYLAGNCGITWVSWMLASGLGIALAQVIPTRWGLGFAGILALVAVLCSLLSSRLRSVSAVVAAAVAILAYGLPLRLNILVAITAAVACCMALEQWPVPAGKERP